MIILLYGPDSYRRQKNLNTILKTYRDKYSVFSIDSFNLENGDEFLKLQDFCSQTSLFDAKKMAIVKNSFLAGKDIAKDLKNFIKENLKSENTIIILSEENEPSKDLEFLIKDASKTYEFQNLSGPHLEFFIKKESDERKINLTPGAIKFLSKVFENDTWGIITELDKLQLLDPIDGSTGSPNKTVDVKDLENLIAYFEEPHLFQFIDAITKNKTLGQKLPMLENLFLNKEEPAKIFNILASRPFLTFELIKNLADYDVSIKSGKLDYELALIDMALNK